MVNKVYVLINAKPGKTEEIQQQMARVEGVVASDVVTGRCDLIAILEGEDLNKLLNIVARELHHMTGIEKTETLVSVDMSEDLSRSTTPRVM